METVSTTLVFTAAAAALVRYYARKTPMYLVLGAGLLGTALLDAGHTFLTSTACAGCTPTALTSLIPWSGMASRILLSLVVCASWLGWRSGRRLSEAVVFLGVPGCTAGFFLLFLFVPLPPSESPGLIARPADLVPGILFALAAIGYAFKGDWKWDAFEYCLVLFLVVSSLSHVAFLAFSRDVFDPLNTAAHGMKLLSYVLLVSGLLGSMSAVLAREESTTDELRWANEALATEVEERERAEESLCAIRDQLEARVKARTQALAGQNRLSEMSAEIGMILTRNRPLPDTLASCAGTIHRQLDAALVRIWILRKGEETLELQASAGLYTHINGAHARVPLGSAKIGRIAASRTPHLTTDLTQDPLVNQDWAREHGLRSFAGYPLVLDEQLVGVVAVFARYELAEGAMRTLASVADAIALGIRRKLADEALHRSEERFRMAAENGSDVIWEWDMQAGILQNWCAGSGVDSERLPQTLAEFRDMLHPDDRQRVMRALERQRISGRELREEYRVIRHNGEIAYWFSRARVQRDASGMPVRSIGVSSNITERKLGEVARSHLADIIESCEVGIISINLDGTVRSWNAAAESLYGYKAEEMIGEQVSRLLPPDHADEYDHILARVSSGERLEHVEAVRVCKDGRRINVLLAFSPVRDLNGKTTGVAAISTDITERRELERQLAQAQKLESIGQLAAGIAHELNTPIQYIGDNTRFIAESLTSLEALYGAYDELLEAARAGLVPEALVAKIDELARSADLAYLREEIPAAAAQSSDGIQRVTQIVRAIKEFSHPGPLEKAPADLNRALESTALVSRHEWKYVADLQLDLDPNVGLVSCVAGEFNQVVLNLVINAAHAISDSIAQQPGSKGLIVVSSRRDGEWVEVRVRDTGTGIPEEIRPSIFNPFFTTKPVGKGTGQGLAIAHTVIVQRHGGTITFDTEAGRGTTFIIRVPICGVSATQAA